MSIRTFSNHIVDRATLACSRFVMLIERYNEHLTQRHTRPPPELTIPRLFLIRLWGDKAQAYPAINARSPYLWLFSALVNLSSTIITTLREEFEPVSLKQFESSVFCNTLTICLIRPAYLSRSTTIYQQPSSALHVTALHENLYRFPK